MTEKEFLIIVGQKLRIAREQKKLKMRDVGQMVDIYFSHISLIEQGKSSARLTTLKRLADAYGAEVKDFL